MSYIYTTNDIAVFLFAANLKLSDEQKVLSELWREQEHIDEKYCHNEFAFKREVTREMDLIMPGASEELDELDLIMRDVDPGYELFNSDFERDVILQFFKIIRLELLYIPNRDYYKIKLRRLLKYFRYKRRSQALVQNIKQSMDLLSLAPYLRGRVPCDVALIDIDDMVMIRLK